MARKVVDSRRMRGHRLRRRPKDNTGSGTENKNPRYKRVGAGFERVESTYDSSSIYRSPGGKCCGQR